MKGAAIPNIQSADQASNLQQGYTAKAVANLGSNPTSSGSIINSIDLATGENQINHKLGKKLTGWFIVRQRAGATIYDNQDSNDTPAQTLKLTASAPVNVDLFVF